MKSAQIPPKDIKRYIALSNFSTINGKLHLQGIQYIKEYDVVNPQFSMRGYKWGEIWDI